MNNHVHTDDPDTVAACPECDRAAVKPRPDTDGPAYRCTRCAARFDTIVERPNRQGRSGLGAALAPPGEDPPVEALPAEVYVGRHSPDHYHLEACDRRPDIENTRRAEIAVNWKSLDPCKYCIGGLAQNSGNDASIGHTPLHAPEEVGPADD